MMLVMMQTMHCNDDHGYGDYQDDYDDDDDVDILEQLSWQWALVSAKGSNTKNI